MCCSKPNCQNHQKATWKTKKFPSPPKLPLATVVYAGSLALLSGALSVGVIIVTSQTIDPHLNPGWGSVDLELRHSKMM